MTKRTRTFLFLFLTLLFAIITPAVVLYSQGWRLDLGRKRLTQTGAFYFKVWPQGAKIYINETLSKKTGSLISNFGTAFIENLVPKQYKVEISKDGYRSWSKILEIKPKLVTDAKNVFLFPENQNFFLISKTIDYFSFSPNGERVIIKKPEEQKWYLSLFEPERQVQSFLAEKKGEILNLHWSSDSRRVFLETSSGESLKNYVIEADQSPANVISVDFIGKTAEQVSFNTQNSEELFYLSNASLFRTNYFVKEISKPLLNLVVTYKMVDNNFYFLDQSGFLYKSDLSFGFQEKINSNPFSVKNETGYEIYIFEPYFFIKEDAKLYSFNTETKSFDSFFDSIKNLKLSPDYKKIVYFSDSEAWIMFLTDIHNQPDRKAGDKVFINRFSEKIDDILWLNDNYLALSVNGKIKISEIDDRDKINIIDFNEFTTDNGKQELKIHFNNNPKDKKLYILNGESFYNSEILVP